MRILGRLGDALDAPVPAEPEGRKHPRAIALLAHGRGQRPAPAQAVEHQARHERPVLGPGVASVVAPGLQGPAHGEVPLLDLFQHPDRRTDPAAVTHGRTRMVEAEL